MCTALQNPRQAPGQQEAANTRSSASFQYHRLVWLWCDAVIIDPESLIEHGYSFVSLPGKVYQASPLSAPILLTLPIHLQSAHLNVDMAEETIKGYTTLWIAYKKGISKGEKLSLHCRQCQITDVSLINSSTIFT